MGELADEIIQGFVCKICSDFIDGDAPGHPRKCQACIAALKETEWT